MQQSVETSELIKMRNSIANDRIERILSCLKKMKNTENKEEELDPSYFELRLESNELTQSVYIKITDYSDFDDQKELADLWHSLIDALRKTVGG